MVTFLIGTCTDSNQMLQLNIKMRKQKMYRNCIEISHIYHSSFSAQSYVHIKTYCIKIMGHTVLSWKCCTHLKTIFDQSGLIWTVTMLAARNWRNKFLSPCVFPKKKREKYVIYTCRYMYVISSIIVEKKVWKIGPEDRGVQRISFYLGSSLFSYRPTYFRILPGSVRHLPGQ